MDSSLLNMYISRILSGYYIFLYNKNRYKLLYPCTDIKYEAELYAREEFEQNKYNEWITDGEILDYLVNVGLWSYAGDDNLKKLENQIEDLKVELYKNFLNPSKTKSLKRTLLNTKNSYNRQYSLRHSLDQYTLEGYLQYIKNNYILIHSLYDNKDNRLFACYEDADYRLLSELSLAISENIIEVTVFRAIARSDVWKNYWNSNKNNLFDRAAINWTDEQRTLVILTKMYDSVVEHPECPPDNIFEDDDLFDGWMILQRRENEKLRNKNRTEKMLDGKNIKNAGEVFIMANTKEEAQNIYNLNDSQSRGIIRERENVLMKTSSTLNENELPDVQRNLVIQSNQQFKNTTRK